MRGQSGDAEQGQSRRALTLLEPKAAVSGRAQARSWHPAQGSRRTVVHLSGEPETRVVLGRVARRWPTVRFEAADSAATGVRLVNERRPDLVVLDAVLRDADGEAMVRTLRAGGDRCDFPILVLGNDPGPRERARFAWAGATAYVSRPLHVAELDRIVRILLEASA